MSRRTLPLLYLNLSGEMIYIIQERLEAQNTNEEKSVKVLNDLISLIFNPKILDEIFKPQAQHSKDALELIFDNIANASSMRLDALSMQRLYGLMLMSTKYQFHRCGSPRDVIGITLNHLDGMRVLLKPTSRAILLIDRAYDMIAGEYSKVAGPLMGILRQTLLSFYQDLHSKIVRYINSGQQNKRTGRFTVPTQDRLSYGIKTPVKISYLDSGSGKVMKLTMVHEPGAEYTELQSVVSWAPICREGESRGTLLGTNIFKNQDLTLLDGHGTTQSEGAGRERSNSHGHGDETRTMSRQELALLRTVLDSRGGPPKSNFMLNLYNNAEQEHKFLKEAKHNSKQYPQKSGSNRQAGRGRITLPKIKNPSNRSGGQGLIGSHGAKPDLLERSRSFDDMNKRLNKLPF